MKHSKKCIAHRIFVALLAIIILTTVVLVATVESKGLGVSRGRLLIADNGRYILVVDKTPIMLSDRSDSKDLFEGFGIGDELLVIHDGINESYPAQTGVYYAIRFHKGSQNEIPSEVIDQLTALGWLSEK